MTEQDAEWVEGVRRRIRTALEAKEALGVNQSDVGKEIGISRGGISLLVNTSAFRGWRRLYQIASALGVSADELLGLKPSAPIVPIEEAAVEDLMTSLGGAVRAAETIKKAVVRRAARSSREKKEPV